MAGQSQQPSTEPGNDAGTESTRETGTTSETAGPVEEEGRATTQPPDLSLDLLFDALKNSRRRHVLQYLREREGRTSLSDLAEHVAAIENDTTAQALSSQQRKRVYVGLYQCHLPKLDDMDVIDFDKNRGHVELGPTAPQLYPYLSLDESADVTSSRDGQYAGFAAVTLLVLLSGVATGLLQPTGAVFVLVGTAVGVALLAAATVYRRGR